MDATFGDVMLCSQNESMVSVKDYQTSTVLFMTKHVFFSAELALNSRRNGLILFATYDDADTCLINTVVRLLKDTLDAEKSELMTKLTELEADKGKLGAKRDFLKGHRERLGGLVASLNGLVGDFTSELTATPQERLYLQREISRLR